MPARLWAAVRIRRTAAFFVFQERATKYNVLLIVYASIVHLVWGGIVLFSGTQRFTAATILIQWFPEVGIRSFILIVVALLAIASTQWIPAKYVAWRAGLLVPQQIVLLLSAIAILIAVAEGHFGDGVPRSRPFILLDQLPWLMLATFYTIAFWEPPVRLWFAGRQCG